MQQRPIGPEPIIPPGVPPPTPPDFEEAAKEWERKHGEYLKQAQMEAEQYQQLETRLKALGEPPEWVPSWLEWIPDVGYASYGPFGKKGMAARIRPEMEILELSQAKSEFYTMLYSQVPYVMSTGGSTDPDEILSSLRPPANMTDVELEEVRDTITEMSRVITGVPLAEMALEAEPPEMPELVPPTAVVKLPTTISTLTVDAIVRSLTTPKVPPSIMSEEEWIQHLIDSGKITSKADLESVEYMKAESDRIVAEWEDWSNKREAFRAQLVEMPQYKLGEMLKEAAFQPGLMALDAANVYFEHVSKPLAGLVWGGYISDIDVAYWKYKAAGEGTWQALAHAWDDWDAPFEGSAEWILKYMLMEGLVDPLSYVGWGIASRITKPLGSIGRVVGATERGIAQVLELPFDFLKWVPRSTWSPQMAKLLHVPEKYVGKYVIPKTLGQHATIEMNKAAQYVDKFLTQRYGKALYQMTIDEWDKGVRFAVKHTLRHPQVDNDITRAGRELLKHTPVTEKEAIEWANRLGTILTPEQVTKQTIDNVDRVFEDFFSKVGGSKKLITDSEAAGELIKILYGDLSPKFGASDIAAKLLRERAQKVINSAYVFAGKKTTFKAMRSLMTRNYRTYINAMNSDVALLRKEMGSVATLFDDIPTTVQKAWQNGLDKWVVKPFAETYLTFAMYGPMNVVEDIIRSALGGVMPGYRGVRSFARKHAGMSYDPDLMRDAASETFGFLRARPEGELNNWLLQLGGLAKGFGDRVYGALVRLPGHVGIGARRNFIDGKATQIFKELGGEQFTRLANVGPAKLTGVANKRWAKKTQQAVTELKVMGVDRTAFNALKDEFSRPNIMRREVNDILLEHPDLPRPSRDFLMRQTDDGLMFSNVVTPSKTVAETIPDAAKYKIHDCYRNSWKWAVDNRAGTIVQGNVYSPMEGKIIRHSWVEVGNDVVDPTTGVRMDRGDWYKLSQAQPDIAFTQDQYAIISNRTGKHGEWTPEQIGDNFIRPENVDRTTVPRREATIGDSIDGSIREADAIMVNDFITSPERAYQGFEKLTDDLIQLEVRNPQELAQLITSLNLMSSTYGSTPKQILGRAVESSRKLPFAERRTSIDRALDDITIFREKAGASMDRLMEKIKIDMMSGMFDDNPAYILKAEQLFNLQTAKRVRAAELGEEINAWRHEWFAKGKPKPEEQPISVWWDDFYSEATARHHTANVEMAEFDGSIKNALDDLDTAGGAKPRRRKPIKITDRELAPNDVAQLLGVRTDDISRDIMTVLTAQNDRDMFIAYVMAHVRPGKDVGFTKESVGKVFDQLFSSLHIDPKTASWLSARRLELEAVRQDLHNLHNSKMLPDDEMRNLHKYIDDSATAVDDVMHEGVGKKRTLKSEYGNYQELHQQALDGAHKWYYKEFTDYTHGNMFDACMKAIYPFWTYESQRWFWLPRSFVRHPGTFSSFERWQNNTDHGYIHVPGTSVDIGLGRGTVYGTLQTRLSRRDYPEYYDSLGAASDIIEFNDFLTRYGFYPGAHIGIPLAMFGGPEMQAGEALPAIFKTPLDALIATFPENESVRWISDHIFADRFRDYMLTITINKLGGDGTLIYSKMKEKIELTPEEEQYLTDARREVGWYTAGFEQFGLFRLRTDEQYKMYEEASKVIEEMTGITPEQQDYLRDHNYRIWDMVGGMSPSEQAILQEMDYYRWVGNIRPLLPGRQQEILNKIELAWDAVDKHGEIVQEGRLRLQRELLSGSRGPRDYKDELVSLFTKQREFIDNKIEEYPLMDLSNRAEYYREYKIPQPVLHPMKELLNLYFSIELKEITDPETGEKMRDWDTFWAQRQAIEDAIPDKYKKEWDDFISKNSTRMEEVRRDVHTNYFRAYDKLWEKILTTYPEEEQGMIKEYLYLERTGQQLDRQAQIKATQSTKTGDMLISSFRSEVSGARKALRFANPHLDAWLYYWGRTTSFTSLTGEDIYHRLAAETGRRV